MCQCTGCFRSIGGHGMYIYYYYLVERQTRLCLARSCAVSLVLSWFGIVVFDRYASSYCLWFSFVFPRSAAHWYNILYKEWKGSSIYKPPNGGCFPRQTLDITFPTLHRTTTRLLLVRYRYPSSPWHGVNVFIFASHLDDPLGYSLPGETRVGASKGRRNGQAVRIIVEMLSTVLEQDYGKLATSYRHG